MKNKINKNLINIKIILPFSLKLNFLTIFDAMKTGRLHIWSWRSSKN